MRNIFHHSRSFLEKHKNHHHVVFAIFALLVVGIGSYVWRNEIVQAASFTFTQSSWAGGTTASTANHASNQTGWTQYESVTTATAGTDLQLPSTSFAFTDDGATSTTPTASTFGGGFSNGTNSNTSVSGSGTSASVALTGATNSATWSSMTSTPGAVGTGGALVYPGSGDYIYGLRGAGTSSFYRYSISGDSWATMTSAPAAVAEGGALVYAGGNYIYGFRGWGNATFYRYSISGDSWTTMTSAPGTISFGGSLVYPGSGDYIYGYQGASTTFYRYSISGDSWTTMTSAPGTISSGGALVYPGSGDYIYGFQGGGAASFYRYSISGDSWTTMTSAPGVIGAGGALVYPGSGDYIYGLRGGSTATFYRYSISGDSWTSMTAIQKVGSAGSALVYPGSGDYIYALMDGSSANFHRYSISSESGNSNPWTTMTSAPGTISSGGSLVYPGSGDYIYGFRGNITASFYRYSISGDSWTTMTSAPGVIGAGGALVYPGSGDYIYGLRGGLTTDFYRYSISGDSWTTMAVTPGTSSNGSIVYPGSGDFIYVLRGANLTDFYRYSISGDSWTTMAVTPGTDNGNGSALVYPGSGDFIYALRGNTYTSFYRYSISGDSWTTMTSAPGTIGNGGALVYPGSGDYIYGLRGANYTFYRYSISGDSWTTMTSAPGVIGTGGALVYPGSGDYIYGYRGNNTTDFYRYSFKTHPTSGIFTSAVIDLGAQASPTTTTFTTTLPTNTGITVDMRAGNTATPDGTWTAWQTGIASGGSISGLAGNRYVQYRANFSTSNIYETSTFNTLTANYTQTSSSGVLVSSPYNTQDTGNLISKITWTGSATSSVNLLKFQIRSSADGIIWSNWCGSSITCDGTDYFLEANNGVTISSSHPLRNGGNDQYLQYRVYLISGGASTPVLNSVVVQYVVNAPPSFDATYGTNGLIVSQVTDSESANFGKVTISYKIRDVDTTTGTNTPGYVTPSFEYNTGGGWTALTTNLASGDTSNKAVDASAYTTYTATWTASSTATVYTTSAQVRVTLNDNEAANNTASATSASFTLDTTAPAISTFTIDTSGSQDLVNLTTTDDTTAGLQYRLCSVASFSGCDAWTSITSGAATPINWTFTLDANGNPTVYLQVRDAYGNVTSRTGVGPIMPTNFDYKDVSNVSVGVYWEFLSWGVYSNVTDASFGSYKVYHSIDGTNYSLLTTITDSSVNYYRHNITTATSSTQFYKVTAVDSDGDISDYTTVLSDIPNGQGSSDTTAPTVSSIAVPSANLKNTSAQVTFTTDELAAGTIEYSTQSANNYAQSAVSSSYALSHSMYITGLASNTTYVFRVKATDVVGNVSTAVDGGTFTTVGGPVITNVTESNITDITATIFWNTATSSDSYVYYSTNSSVLNPSTSGSATLVSESPTAGVFQHQVGLSGLTAGTRYYYYVKSTDGSGNSTIDNNNGSFYSFVTTLDTTPPTISNIDTPVKASNAVVIVWQTDEPATTQVLYGTSTGDRSKYTTTDTTKSVYHVVTLSSATNNAGVSGGTNELTPETIYYYVVRSADTAGNTTTSAETTVTTPSTGNVTIVAVSVSSATGVVPDTSAPIISNIKLDEINTFDASVSFNTSEDAVSFIDYGKDSGYGDSVGSHDWIKTHAMKLKGLTMGTDYRFKVRAIDKSGNMGNSDEQIFKTKFLTEDVKELTKIENIEQFQKEIEETIESILPSLVPPFVAKPQITDITENGATVKFKTNIKAFPVVGYTEDTLFDVTAENPYISEVSNVVEKSTDHEIVLVGLKQNTKYHVQARAFSIPRVIGKSTDVTFTTQAAKIQGSIVERKKDSFTVVWVTDEPTTSMVEYRNTRTGITERKTDDAKRTSHSVKIENLPSGTTYEVNISGINEQGNVVEAGSALSVTTSRDVTPPVISGFKVDNALVPGRTDRIQTIISWKTDEPSTSTAYYEEGTGAVDDTKELANKVEDINSYTTGHSVIVPNLKPGTIYRLKIDSIDDSGNKASFGPRTIITPKQTESITDIIFKNFEDSFKFLRNI